MNDPNESYHHGKGARMTAAGMAVLNIPPEQWPDFFAPYENDPKKLQGALFELASLIVFIFDRGRAPLPEELSALVHPATLRVLQEVEKFLVEKSNQLKGTGGTA